MQKLEFSEDISSESQLWHISGGSNTASRSSRWWALRPSPAAAPYQLLLSSGFFLWTQWPLDLPFLKDTTLAPASKPPDRAAVLNLGEPENAWQPCGNTDGWAAPRASESGSLVVVEGWWGGWESVFLTSALAMLMVRPTLWKPWPRAFLSLQSTSSSNSIDPSQLHQKWNEKFCSRMYITPQVWEKWKTHSVQTPMQPWQNKTHLPTALLCSPHPPTFILPVSLHLCLCTDGQDCVCVYTSPALLVYMYTFVFLLLPH